MIRYIDIGDQVYPHGERKECTQFSWWDTVTDSFLEFNQNQMWDSWDEFAEDFWLEVKYPIDKPKEYLERFKGLFPKEKK